jgi:hypothetical protein
MSTGVTAIGLAIVRMRMGDDGSAPQLKGQYECDGATQNNCQWSHDRSLAVIEVVVLGIGEGVVAARGSGVISFTGGTNWRFCGATFIGFTVVTDSQVELSSPP